MYKYLMVFFIALALGYFWCYSAMKKYIVSEENCKEFYFTNLAISSTLYSEVVTDFLTSNTQLRGDVFLYYTEDGSIFKIRKIK